MKETDKEKNWDLVIRSKTPFLRLGLKELYRYRDLVMLFAKRDIVAQYKQTLLGPTWLVIQPILSTIFNTIIFGTLAKFDTKGIPYPVFILSGLTAWNFFASAFNKTSGIFITNASIFGKVYFPRLTVPLASIISNFITFIIQFALLLCLLLFYKFQNGYDWEINYKWLLALPLLLGAISLLGLGAGLVISSLTTKYRDLTFLTGFIMQFLMYFSSVAFPINSFGSKWEIFFKLNPILHLVSLFRAIVINAPLPDVMWLAYSIVSTLIILIIGILIFNKVEKSFMDTV